MRVFVVGVMLLSAVLARASVTGFEDVVHASTLIARVHVDGVGPGEGSWGQKGTLTVVDVIHGPKLTQLEVLSQDNSFSGVEVLLLARNEQLVFLRQEKVNGRDAWVVLEAFTVDKHGTVRMGHGSTTWWVMKPRGYGEAAAAIRAELARPAPTPPAKPVKKAAPPDVPMLHAD